MGASHHSSAPHAGQALGRMERSPPPWADPTAGLPPALPTLPASFPELRLSKIGELSLGLISPFFC